MMFNQLYSKLLFQGDAFGIRISFGIPDDDHMSIRGFLSAFNKSHKATGATEEKRCEQFVLLIAEKLSSAIKRIMVDAHQPINEKTLVWLEWEWRGISFYEGFRVTSISWQSRPDDKLNAWVVFNPYMANGAIEQKISQAKARETRKKNKRFATKS